MAIVHNLAMTPQEIQTVKFTPEGAAWMSCHFDPDGKGLMDLPPQLPRHAMLILDDSTPMISQDSSQILSELKEALERIHFEALLLDFQQKGSSQEGDLAKLLSQELSCPVGVSEGYAQQTEGPVFLPLLPPHRPLVPYLLPWKGRELWLEIGPGCEQALVTETGTTFTSCSAPLPPCPQLHKGLCCHYGIQPEDRQIRFTLVRTPDDLRALRKEAETLGVTRTVGLYQELV